VGFNIFGKKLLTIQGDAKSIAGQDSSSTMKRMIIIMFVSSITLVAQIIFLFIVTYSSVSAEAALIAYVLTEIIPSATLILALRPLSKRVAKRSSDITTSTEMKINSQSTASMSETNSQTSMI